MVGMAFILVGCVTKEKKENGRFYTLQEAYIEKLLTVDDLQNIATYHNSGKQVDDTLNIEVVNKIKEIAAYNMRNSESTPVNNAKASDFTITKYYGTYNKSVVFIIDNPYFAYPAEELDINETIAGVSFHYSTPDRISVWININ